MIRLSWIVFLHAALLSIESIVIELLTTQLNLSPLMIAGNSILIAGAVLMLIVARTHGQGTLSIMKSWKFLLPGSVLLGLGVFTWYDSVTSVGASKEGLLAGPVETVVILILARGFLKEKLGRLQMAGALIALGGFFVIVMSGSTTLLSLTWGDLEAVISAIAFAGGIIFITKLTRSYSALQVTAATLFISGAILASVLWITTPTITGVDWTFLVLFSILPLSAALTYVVGLRRIGASLTSTIASFSILLTVVFQLLMLNFGVTVILPSHVPLAILGGILGVFGIYLIHSRQGN